MTVFFLALAIFIDKWKVSREMYQDLRTSSTSSILSQSKSPLPKRVDTVKRALNDQLPLLKQREQELKLDSTMVPTHSSHTDNICLFDMEDVFRQMAHSATIKSWGHFGMVNIVDVPSEFWESESWGALNQTTSGEFAMIRGGKGSPQPILASEFVWFFDDKNKQRLGCVLFIGRDYSTEASTCGVEDEVQTCQQANQANLRLCSDLFGSFVVLYLICLFGYVKGGDLIWCLFGYLIDLIKKQKEK
jgi:hypothetical protein